MALTALAAALVLAATAACAGDDDAPPALTTPISPLLSEDIPLDVPIGAPIVSAAGLPFLALVSQGRQLQPVAAWGDRFLVTETDTREGAGETQRILLWDPSTETSQPLWTSDPGKQDIIAGVDRDSAVYVRVGLALPFADWSLQVRDLVTGDVRTIAEASRGIESAEGVSPAPPFGLAPAPAVAAGRVAWAEYTLQDGHAQRALRLYDLATGTTTTLATANAAGGEDLDSPALGGTRAAWIRHSPNGPAAIEIHDLATGAPVPLGVDADPFAIALSNDGQHLAWDDAHGGKYMVSLDTGRALRFAGDEGWGVTASGNRFAWSPAAAYGGTGGYFDAGEGQLRLIPRRSGVQVNFAAVLGGWFAWQEIHTEDGKPNLDRSGYYFLRLAS